MLDKIKEITSGDDLDIGSVMLFILVGFVFSCIAMLLSWGWFLGGIVFALFGGLFSCKRELVGFLFGYYVMPLIVATLLVVFY